MDKDNKKAAMIIMEKMNSKKGNKYSDDDEKDHDYEGLDAASEEILSAIEKSDSKKLKKALKNFIELCNEE